MIGQLLTGRYLILEKLGAGGFSETYLARDKYLPHHPLCVVKRLKLSRSNTISPDSAQRLFEMEARLLEKLGQNHPQIPTLFAYCHEQDQIYLVQEFVEGENLGGWLKHKKRFTPKAAIELLLEVLPVLDYIHSRRVIHRDIKPSNLIRRYRDGKFVLIDFGAACFLPETNSSTQPESDDTPFAIGTPGYMPDEQHLGMSQLNSDLYALGAVVIHLLTGVHPRQFEQDLISGELNWHSHLPDKPIEPQLIAILDRMVRVRFDDRYQQAAEVLADVQALPVVQQTQQQKSLPRWQKMLRRAGTPAAAVLLMGVLGGKYLPAHSHQAESWLKQIGQMFDQSEVQLTKLRELPVQSNVEQMLVAANNRVLITAETDHALHLWSLPDGSMLNSLSGHTDKVTALATCPKGRFLISGSNDRTVRLWNTESGESLQTLTGHQQPITAVAMSPDTRTIASGSKDGTLRLWDAQTGALIRTMTIPNAEVTAVVFGTTPNSLISASSDRQLQVWDLSTGKLQRTFSGHTEPIVSLKVVDDHTLYSFGKDRGLAWDLRREELVSVFPEASAKSLTASLDQQRIVTVDENSRIRVWQREADRLVMKQAGELDRNLGVALSPNQRYLVSWSPDRHLQIWQINTRSIQ
jgi:serine/threonine protein kinase